MNLTSVFRRLYRALLRLYPRARRGFAAEMAAQTKIPDALTADAAQYTVLYENAGVRALRIHCGPHEKGNMHDHPRSVTVELWNHWARCRAAGKSSLRR